MKNEDFLKYFRLICIDGNEDKYSNHISMVPSMMASNVPKMLAGEDTFKWVQNMKLLKQKNQKTGDASSEASKNLAAQSTTGFLPAYSIEMSGFSDKFAYLNTDNAQTKEFLPYDAFKSNETTIYTAPSDDNKISRDEQRKLITNVSTKRHTEESQFKDIITQQQQDALNGARRR